MKNIKKICIGHKAPEFKPTDNFIMLCPESTGVHDEIIISDHRFGINYDGASLAEYSQLFGLAEMIKSGDFIADGLYLFQYRKFISPKFGGYDSVASWTKVLSSEMAADFFPDQDSLKKIGDKLIVGSILDFGESISKNYSRVHEIEDFVNFSVACSSNSNINLTDLKLLSGMRGIIPSPALCYITPELFLEFIGILRETCDIYMKNFHIKRSGYQMRSTGYLLERLHSLLICKKLLNAEISSPLIWNRFVINTDI